ncbi:hypothetical protein RLOatenuis_0750 [Rickettsiales bacterium]|nr:hypothetical protein RLOatenuis_0750 [Rickettsiales bacterium]
METITKQTMTTETMVHPVIISILEKHSCESSAHHRTVEPMHKNSIVTENLITMEEGEEVELSLGEIWDKAGEIWDKVTDEAEEFLDDVVEDVGEFIDDVGDKAKEIWSELSDEAKEVASKVMDAVKDEAMDLLKNQAEEVVMKLIEEVLSEENPDASWEAFESTASAEHAEENLALPGYHDLPSEPIYDVVDMGMHDSNDSIYL